VIDSLAHVIDPITVGRVSIVIGSTSDVDPEHDEIETELALKGAVPAQPTSYQISVVEGPDTGARLVLDGTEPTRVFVGQSPVCPLLLTDKQISRRHVAFAIEGRRLRITDLESTNGTFVDGIALRDGDLRGGEIVRIGKSALLVETLDAGAPPSLPAAKRFGRTIGASSEMRRLYPLCRRLADSSVTLIIEGETGTGKEVLAESLHEEGPRASEPFVVFDCTAVASNLVESALFGHEKGAFTGAIGRHLGVFEQAHRGTLLIDEIGDLELALQPKLLRAIERGEVTRVGGSRPTPVDVRVICATRRDLDREVQAGRFRDDLFFRLSVARIELPPLASRKGDIPLLAQHFFTALGGEGAIPFAQVRRFEDYSWPGNLRELHNAVARFLALGELEPSTALRADTPRNRDVIEDTLARSLPFPKARDRVLEHFERRYVERVLAEHDGNVAAAAAASGIARRYFQLIRARTLKSG
jgi:DNA-binding NtrC family response regulator